MQISQKPYNRIVSLRKVSHFICVQAIYPISLWNLSSRPLLWFVFCHEIFLLAANDKATKTETAKEEQASPILIQMGIFAAILFVSSLISPLFPATFPVPTPVIGLVILYILLASHIVKLRNVEKFGDFMISLIAFCSFLQVSIGTSLDILKAQGVQLVCYLNCNDCPAGCCGLRPPDSSGFGRTSSIVNVEDKSSLLLLSLEKDENLWWLNCNRPYGSLGQMARWRVRN